MNLDAAQMGVGGDDSWGALPHPQYAIPPIARSYEFVLMPYKHGDERPQDAAQSLWRE